MKFTKAHGLGNDFVITADMEQQIQDTAAQARAICNRRTGIGADGWILVRPSEHCDVQMKIYNSDGSVAEMCGNGIRCFAKFVYETGIVPKKQFTVQTLAGPMVITLTVENGVVHLVRVNMGRPEFACDKIPVAAHGTFQLQTICVEDRQFLVSAVLLGVPHLVVFLEESLTEAQIARYGAALERHALFPEKTNVNFVQVADRRHIIQRTWERGCGRTFACGTGASSSAVLCAAAGKTEKNVTVQLELGSLYIEVAEEAVYMSGPAELVYTGEYAL